MVQRIGYIVGSISRTSINRRLARALESLAPPSMVLREIDYSALPFYSPDFDADYPEVALEFKRAIADADGVIIVTPEYSRSIPGVLKNALDWSARPRGEGALDGKPVAIIGTSPGAIGTAAAQQHLRAILANLNAPTLAQPEAFVQFHPELFDADGDVSNASTADFLRGYLVAFSRFVDTFARALQVGEAESSGLIAEIRC